MSRILIAIFYGIGGMLVSVVVFALLGTVFGISNTGPIPQACAWIAFFVFGFFGLRGGKQKAKARDPSPGE